MVYSKKLGETRKPSNFCAGGDIKFACYVVGVLDNPAALVGTTDLALPFDQSFFIIQSDSIEINNDTFSPRKQLSKKSI
jgi:hypothetical protein